MPGIILDIDDIWTAIDKGYETIANLQLAVAKKSRVAGDPKITDKKMHLSSVLYANIDALSSFNLNHSSVQNENIRILYDNIKLITKDIRRWD